MDNNKNFAVIPQAELFSINGGTFRQQAAAYVYNQVVHKEAEKVQANGNKQGVNGKVLKEADKKAADFAYGNKNKGNSNSKGRGQSNKKGKK